MFWYKPICWVQKKISWKAKIQHLAWAFIKLCCKVCNFWRLSRERLVSILALHCRGISCWSNKNNAYLASSFDFSPIQFYHNVNERELEYFPVLSNKTTLKMEKPIFFHASMYCLSSYWEARWMRKQQVFAFFSHLHSVNLHPLFLFWKHVMVCDPEKIQVPNMDLKKEGSLLFKKRRGQDASSLFE